MGEEKESPCSGSEVVSSVLFCNREGSVTQQKMAITKESMTNAEKWELQEMLMESHEELERLWNHNKILVERLQHLQGSSRLEQESEVESKLPEHLQTYEQQQSYLHLAKPFNPECQAGTASSDTLRQLIDMHAEKMSLLEKLNERDAQLKEMHEILAKVDVTRTNNCCVKRSLSVEAFRSPEYPKVEVC